MYKKILAPFAPEPVAIYPKGAYKKLDRQLACGTRAIGLRRQSVGGVPGTKAHGAGPSRFADLPN